MRYTIRHEFRFIEPFFLGDGKSDPESTTEEDCVRFHRTKDPEIFRKMLLEIADIPEYDLTEENVRKEFSYARELPLKGEVVDRIIRFYSGRKAVFDKIIADIGKFSESGGSYFYRIYRYPEESLGFSTEDKCEYAPFANSETVDITLEAGL